MTSIPTRYEYEKREAQEFQRQLRQAEANPSRRSDCKHFQELMAADPALIGERIVWLLDGTYGYGAMQAAQRVVRASGRTNKAAALVQMIAAIEWQCPRRGAISAWKALSPSEKRALDAAVKRAISAASSDDSDGGR